MIYIIEGPPGHGKTVFGTLLAMESMRDRGTRGVFTTWPVHDIRTGAVSRIWQREYVYRPIFDSDIFIDEAYLWYPSRGSGRRYVDSIHEPGMTHEEHMMFAASRHNGNRFYIISQSINRLDTILREIYDRIYRVRKQEIPILSRIFAMDVPLRIIVEGYIDESDIRVRKPFERESLWNMPGSRLRRVFRSYDTQFLRRKGEMDLSQYPCWSADTDMVSYMLQNAGLA